MRRATGENLLPIPGQATALKAADKRAGDLAGVLHGGQPFDNDLFNLFGADRIVRRGLFFGRANDQLGGMRAFDRLNLSAMARSCVRSSTSALMLTRHGVSSFSMPTLTIFRSTLSAISAIPYEDSASVGFSYTRIGIMRRQAGTGNVLDYREGQIGRSNLFELDLQFFFTTRLECIGHACCTSQPA